MSLEAQNAISWAESGLPWCCWRPVTVCPWRSAVWMSMNLSDRAGDLLAFRLAHFIRQIGFGERNGGSGFRCRSNPHMPAPPRARDR